MDTKECHDKNGKTLESRSPHSLSSSLLIDLFHSQTKQIINTVLILTRQSEIDFEKGKIVTHNRPLSPINNREQMQLVKSIAISVRDLLQTLDYAPLSIKEMVKNFLLFFK